MLENFIQTELGLQQGYGRADLQKGVLLIERDKEGSLRL